MFLLSGKMQNFKCSLCEKTFPSSGRLKAHEAKDIPCDFICRECGEECFNRHRYYRHKKGTDCELNCQKQLVVHQKTKAVEKKAKKVFASKEVMESPDNLVPLSDFMSYETYKDFLSKVNEHGQDCRVTLRETTTTVVKEVIVEAPDIEKLQNLLTALRPAALTSLRTLENGRDLDKIVVDVMGQVHARSQLPEHHSIVLSDASRNSSKMYSRDPSTQKCQWNKHPKSSTMGVLNQHGPNMVSLLLEDAVRKLCDATFIRDYTDRRERGYPIRSSDRYACVYLVTEDEENALIIHYDEDAVFYSLDSEDNTPLRVEYILFEDMFTCDENFQEAADRLRSSVENRKDEVLRRLKTLMINEKILIEFLHSIQPMKNCIKMLDEPRILLD